MNRKLYNLSIVFVAIVVILNAVNCWALTDLAKITISVLDESENPIEGARVGIGFGYNKNWATDETGKAGLSDSKGMFSALASTNGHVGWNITKEGYYKTLGSYDFVEKSAFGWKPWNPELKVVLRKIENPMPMYARQAEFKFPIDNKYIGFDLVKCDWVAPYGNGADTDFIFKIDVIDNGGNDFEYNLEIKFPNKFDGMIEYEEDMRQASIFKLPRTAPVEGYKNEHNAILRGVKRGAKISWKESRHYIFRVRSEEEGGELKRAMYGKIISDIMITGAKKGGMPGLKFKYYLNPDYTRNLEFDPKRNLFVNLSSLEGVDQP